LAAAKLAHEKSGQTLQATALVHEAYLRLVGPAGPKSEVRGRTKAGRLPISDLRLPITARWEGPTGTPAATSLPPRPRPCGGS
jgi:hypothetical protein